MNWQEIKLISVTYSKNKYGVDEPTTSEKTVFADVKSISAKEYFSAGQNGINPEFKLIVNADEYSAEEIVEIAGQRYSVYRIYRGLENYIELYVQREVGSN